MTREITISITRQAIILLLASSFAIISSKEFYSALFYIKGLASLISLLK
jgi:hypothetical protein